jgi:hypothetical protein
MTRHRKQIDRRGVPLPLELAEWATLTIFPQKTI